VDAISVLENDPERYGYGVAKNSLIERIESTPSEPPDTRFLAKDSGFTYELETAVAASFADVRKPASALSEMEDSL
jgi:hypothetical protein